MKCQSFVLFFVAACGLYAETKPPGVLTVGFPDGSGLEIRTESTGASAPLSTSGSVYVGAGNESQRVVFDKQGNVLFGYEIEFRKTGRDTMALRIKPIDPDKIRAYSWYPKKDGVPTLSVAREFTPLKAGDAVQVDILYNPATGEKIYDVLKVPLKQPAPQREGAKVTGERFSFEDVQVTAGGKVIVSPSPGRNTWMIGGGMMIYLPRRGEFYLALSPPGLQFRAAGWVDHTVLRFHAGNELIEIAGRSNMLQKAEYGTVWVYHVPEQATDTAADRGVEFRCADDVESLLPKRLRQD